ncbi:MAG: UDP-3-O-(3-hydroxymyristoyl)glucosamine N-acyltransferase [Hyphomicrobium sp.]|uniref:UDP-3-O-(3-hydroxymyristoyl)glucosamine N-acyltransferase n=1 Tax=Hyphomicrobium sp. TaxID=82 RepID=UPI0013244F3E|nr:UDP-3-O-(3-hydroxymyristoyl)glucosamine N-acyltransferase [Hyphomicrobium sp.]KAB2941110.1 MAG: UDP-3-O-(3-hydroxymyristoyl)glucosamine N-acyltransferase [Hyphomicrobium sp.]MBZ0211008.1 UDP-3-O-(3-hydroxymyristoyl)glucosamine N-acyltransferase [Hyphomicrobium sp.]
MEHPGFFRRAGPFSLADIAKATGAELAPGATAADKMIEDVRTLTDAGPRDLSFFNNRKYAEQLKATHAGACLVLPAFAARVPDTTGKLVTPDPYRGFAQALMLFYPESRHSQAAPGGREQRIDPTAELEEGVIIEPGAIVGAEARIGRGTRIAAGAVVGYRVTIGRDSYIGPLATVAHALIGDRVIIHTGVRIGQDGFGFAMSGRGHFKVPQIGRVIIQDDVEIGANSAIDRGALKDTVIGEGSKIDNLVQIGHNVVLGRHCVIVAQTGISGSTELGDFVVMGGQSGTVGHIKIGTGAQIAGTAHPTKDVPPGGRIGGTPGRPLTQWAREVALLTRLAKRGGKDNADEA